MWFTLLSQGHCIVLPCQLAAVLGQVGVRVKDLGLYGIDWLHAARSHCFLEVGKLTLSNVKVCHNW